MKRKTLVFVLSALLVAVTMGVIGIVSAWAQPNEVYVSSSGSDSNSGESEAKALRTFEAAFERMPKGGKIILCGSTYTVEKNYSMPVSESKYTLTSQMTGAFYYSGVMELHSDFLIENITFQGSSTPIIACNGHNVTFGKGIVNNTNSYIVGGANLTASDNKSKGNFTEDYTIEINSGAWVYFFGGNRRTTGSAPTSTITADITIIIDGATFKDTNATITSNHNNLSGMNEVKGNISFIMKSGEIKGSLYAIGRVGQSGGSRKNTGSIDMQILGGVFSSSQNEIKVCQESNTEYNGDVSLKVSDSAVINLPTIDATGVLGRATLDVPSGVVSKCYGFVRDVYVSGTGSDSNGGTSKSDAYKTLDKAVSAVAASGGTIVVCGDVEISSDTVLKASNEDIMITSKYKSENYKSSAKLTVNAGLELGSDTTFDDITLAGTGTIYAGGHTVIAEKGVACDGKLNVSASAMTGDTSSGGQAVLLAGSYNTVSAGSIGGKGAGSVTNTLVSVEGATVKVLTVSGGNDISGSAVASILSGAVTDGIYGIYGTDSAKVSGRAIVEIAGGTVSGKICAVADGVSGEASGSYEFSLLGGNIGAVTVISGKGFANTTAKAPDEHLSKLSDFDKVAKELVLFVRDGGSGKRDGSSADNAMASIKDAINAFADNDGTIVICGTVTANEFVEPTHKNGKVRITSRYAGVDWARAADAKLILKTKYTIGGEVLFDDLVISTDGSTRIFFGNGYPIGFGEGVKCIIEGSGSTYPYIFGGSNDQTATLTGASVTVSGGTWHRVIGANRYEAASVYGDITVTVNGGEIRSYVVGASCGRVKGNISIDINGGKIGYGVFAMLGEAGKVLKVDGNIDVHIDGGDIGGKINAAHMDKYVTFNGVYNCYINIQGLDSVTDIRGAVNTVGDSESRINYGVGVDPYAKVDGTAEYQNPQCSGADPWVIYHEGYYYMAVTRGSSVTIAKAPTVAQLGDAEPVAVWTPTEATGLGTSIWSPELHYFSAEEFGAEHAGWYLYVACIPYDEKDGNSNSRRCYAIKALTDDPQGEYGSPVDGRLNMAVQIKMDRDNSNWNIGPSVFRINGKIYMTWTGEFYDASARTTKQTLNIAEMINPYTIDIDTHGVICTPTESWEKHGATYNGEGSAPEVVEGATAVYGPNGEVYCIYSASGYWTDYYALAQLKYKGGDPTDINNWEKYPTPLFVQNKYVFGPGHAAYVQSVDGEKSYFIYHGYQTGGRVGGRYVYVEEYTVDSERVYLGLGSPTDTSVVLSVKKNPMSISERVSAFDNVGSGDSGDVDIDVDVSLPSDTLADDTKDRENMNSMLLPILLVVGIAMAAAIGVVIYKHKKK